MDRRKTEIKFVKAWLLFFIVATVGGFLCGAVAGFVIGLIMGMLGYSVEGVTIYLKIVGFAIGAVVSFFCFKWSISQYIIPQLTEESQENTSPTALGMKHSLQPEEQHSY